MELSSLKNFLRLKRKYPTLKKCLIIWEMELSSLKLRKLLKFQEELPKPQKPKPLKFLLL